MKAPFTKEEVQQVMDALDGEDGSDSNGTIEKLELQAWVSAGIKRPIEERAKFASLSDFNQKLDQFLEGMSIFVKRITGVDVDFLRTNIGKLFDFYDVDNSGAIDENELQEMLQNTLTRSGVSEETFTKTDVQNLAAALNETDLQNFAVSIQKDQLINWIINGLKRTQDEMKVFEMKSATNVLLNQFLIACRIYATQLDVLEEEDDIKKVIAGEVNEETETEMQNKKDNDERGRERWCKQIGAGEE
jgi:Ca2+-binding EF-hand superfamily protein